MLAAISLSALLFLGERRDNRRCKWLFKPFTSALFLAAAWLQGPQSSYDWLVFAGLVLSVIGDVALIPSSRRWFLVGLAAFLLGHIGYTVAFYTRAEPSLPPAALVAILATSLAVYLYLRPRLGSMRLPVIAYIAVITMMMVAAWSVAFATGLEAGGVIALAATLFYASDFTVARDRFMPGAGFGNRLVGLPLYYAAQFLFAFSIGG